MNSLQKFRKAMEARHQRIREYGLKLLKENPGIRQDEFDRKVEEYAAAPHKVQKR